MRQSTLFVKTLREAPSDETAKNAQLLVQAGFVDKLMAGAYSFLPLGLLVLKNIERVIREEMNTVGAQEILMPALHPIENYEKTGRQEIDDLFHTQMNNEKHLVLGQSHEEIVVPLVQKFIHSYRDLPHGVYQIQTKFRNELRAKSGLFRGREFLMKDLYSFHISEDDFERYYHTIQDSYKKIFSRVGLGEKTFFTYAFGGTFSQISHEFQTLTDAGEDNIFICEQCRVAVNHEVRDYYPTCPECKGQLQGPVSSVEIANIFPLKTRFSDAFEFVVKDEKDINRPVVMGCYGIGISRLMGTIAELYHDEKGLVWPKEVAPGAMHLVSLRGGEKQAEKLYAILQKQNVSVLYDDRASASAGEKFADCDLIGIPFRAVVSAKTLEKNSVELRERSSGKVSMMGIEKFIKTYAR